MDSRDNALRKLRNNQISRRDFLKFMAAIGLATPAVSAFLSSCAGSPTITPQATTELTGAAMLETFTKEQAIAAPIIADGWSFLPEVVDNVQKIFQEQYNESVKFEVIPGDFPSTMLNKMIAKAPVDVMYTKSEAAKFLAAGWIIPLNDLANIEQIKKDMLPSFWDALSINDQLTSLPYYGGAKGVVVYNKAILDQIGISSGDLPKTWDELYDLCRRIKKDGAVEYPLVMLWPPNTDGVVHGWLHESMNRGDPVIDANFKAVFSKDSGAAETLNAWNRVWTDKLVSPDSLVLGFSDLRDIFGAGKAAFIVIQSWHLKTLNDPQKSNIAGSAMMVPYAGQAWGLLDYGGYAVVAQPSGNKLKEERAKRWVEFMGYRDKNGEILVGKQWVTEAALFSAYPEVYTDPKVVESFKKWMPEYPKLSDIMIENQSHIQAPYAWKALWYPEWASYLASTLPETITGAKKVGEVIDDLKAKWEQMGKLYSS